MCYITNKVKLIRSLMKSNFGIEKILPIHKSRNHSDFQISFFLNNL